jgi:hypothetical protein
MIARRCVAEKWHGTIVLDGLEYGWNVHRGARYGDGVATGHSLNVFVRDVVGRDLILDFPFLELGTFDRIADHSVIVAALKECIPLAIRAGWEPANRGKPLRLDVQRLREEHRADA